MDLQTIRNIADADRTVKTVTQQLLIAINNLSEIASRDPESFYATVGTDAANRAQQHRELILAMTMLDPETSKRIRWPKVEIVYLADGSAYVTKIPFDPARYTLVADTLEEAKALEATLLAE